MHGGEAVAEPGLFPDFFDLVSNVRAMRRLRPDPVPRELLFKVLNAGVQAPSGQNTQPWEFVVVEAAEPKRWFCLLYTSDAADE